MHAMAIVSELASPLRMQKYATHLIDPSEGVVRQFKPFTKIIYQERYQLQLQVSHKKVKSEVSL